MVYPNRKFSRGFGEPRRCTLFQCDRFGPRMPPRPTGRKWLRKDGISISKWILWVHQNALWPERKSRNILTFDAKVLCHIHSNRLALYMDDICIISKTFEEHLRNLQEVSMHCNATGYVSKLRTKLLQCRKSNFLMRDNNDERHSRVRVKDRVH